MVEATRLLRLLRDAWLIFGTALVILIALEAAYRGRANLRRAMRSADPPAAPAGHPYASEPWWQEWIQGAGGWRNRYDPYRGTWPEPQVGPHLNIDSLGRRVTVQAASASGALTQTVYLLGGSTMFGYTSRDAATIPSQLAALLAAEGRRHVEVVNLAQSMFNIMQGVNTLTLELRAGRVPDIVVFLDGNNEVAPAFQSGTPGTVLNEAVLAQRLRAPRPSLPRRVAESFTFVGRIGRLLGVAGEEGPQLAAPDPEAICPGVAEKYLGAASVVSGLAEAFGFEALFFWQPMLATSGKALTPFERSVRSSTEWRETVIECTREVEALVERRGIDAFAPLGHVFDDRTETVFLDDYGHVTEDGNELIAAAILERLRPLLGRVS